MAIVRPKFGYKANSGVLIAVGIHMAEVSQPTSGAAEARANRAAVDALPASTKENLELLANFKDREEEQLSGAQLLIEKISRFFGSPAYFAFVVAFILAWILVNLWGMKAGWRHVDVPPFEALQGLVSSNALLLTVAVLIRQNRMAQMAEHRSHVDLQVNLLTEQKATKILQLVDQLQRELTGIQHRPDAAAAEEVAELTRPSDTHALLHAVKEKQGNS
jgi:uncharacterized membrane protein